MSGRCPGLALVSREFPPAFGGGIGTYAAAIAQALPAAGVEVHVVTQAAAGLPTLHRAGPLLTVHRVPATPGRGGWTSAFLGFSAAAARLVDGLHREGRVGVAEFAECEGAGLVHALMGGRGCPALVHLHTPAEQLAALGSLPNAIGPGGAAGAAVRVQVERLAVHQADAVLAPSAFIAGWAQRAWGLTTRPEVIPYPHALPPPAEAVPPPQSPRPVVLFVGRLEARKGVEPLVHAWIEVVRTFPAARLRLVGADTGTAPGGGSMKRHLLAVLAEAGDAVAASVRFVGPLPPGALAEQHAAASLCVVPSLWENFPNVCLEAMGRARPVVVSDAGGMAEMIGDTDAGLTFPSGDPRGLAAALLRVLAETPDRRAARGRAGRERIGRLCDPAAVARRRVAHLLRVVAGAGAPRPRCGRTLDAWRALERLAGGEEEPAPAPDVEPAVRRWIHVAPGGEPSGARGTLPAAQDPGA